MSRIANIISTAHYLPEHKVTNAELTDRFTARDNPEVIAKFAASTGIDQRFYAPDDWATSDLALPAAREALRRAGRKPEDVDQLIFTQVRKPTIELAAQNCGVPIEKCHMIMDKWGYTGSACIPMALDDAISLGKVKSGDLVVMIGSGVGYNQAVCAFRM
ncbi:3-oxoacyl-[acyl-carrier-protein] synthase III C-terminal domain-containing protein [Noviherbaspirillum sedimenti]|uniref:Beta-ketoacyl-[acyl-carrier-protein] synthase III C-terminal domain-containing protein n=1 Tax=Noviherbaspirillum sedimenti TaxID=2320865 RepID=A0A3A3GJU8_9BURK|nr:3-oxoacyl-[acyl-carrier-protein] synthase III C-terminal domain-containing protein [Noviherbaspirillum sedimenti]RJG01230.1 hypothetical protein D3878_06225 [Noviherbaspirillum sedimenti]